VEALGENKLTPSFLLNILADALVAEATVDLHQLACALGAPARVTKWLASAKGTDKAARREAIASWTTNPVLLEEMARDESLEVRVYVASNVNTPAAALAWLVAHDKSPKLIKMVAKNPNVSPETLAACQNEYAHHAYAEYARKACSSQEVLTIKVGDTPSAQVGEGGVWLTVKLWVSDINAAPMQSEVVADNGLQAADVAEPEVAEPELAAV
jgi:hypothetical protein